MTSNGHHDPTVRLATPSPEDPVQALLGFCARPALPTPLESELARRAAAVEDWEAALSAAEQHGLGPILYAYLRAARVGVAPHVRQLLQGLYLRHRRANRIRLRALRTIVGALDDRGIDVRVLKGPPLMSLVYPDPALRPASDLDLLVPAPRAREAQRVLNDLGYDAPDGRAPGALGAHHHLPQATRSIDGLLVQVDVHHDALSSDWPVSLQLDAAREAPVAFDVDGRRAFTLGPHEMLWHLCEHLVGPLPRPLRLIWIADVIGWAARFDNRLDWQRVRARYPIVLNVLALAQLLTPLPGSLSSRVPPATLDAFRAAGATGHAWLWPSDRSRDDVLRWHQLRRSLVPPSWWLLLRYGPSAGASSRRIDQLRHLGIVGRAAVRCGIRDVWTGV